MNALAGKLACGIAGLMLAGAVTGPALGQSAISSEIARADASFKSGWDVIVTDALKLGTTVNNFIAVNGPLIEADEQKFECAIANFMIGRAFTFAVGGAVPAPMNAVCGLFASGAGHYLMGNSGPGGIVPFNKATVYLPTKKMGCTEREYRFTFNMTGPNPLVGYLNAAAPYVQKLNSMFAPNGELHNFSQRQGLPMAPSAATAVQGASAAATVWQDVYEEVGDFAFIAALNSFTQRWYMYSLISPTSKAGTTMAALQGNKPFQMALAEAQKIAATMTNASGGIVPSNQLVIGTSIQDNFALDCNYPLVFWYIVGTGNVAFN